MELLKKALKCDLCGGDPECVKFCPRNAIEFMDIDTYVGIKMGI